jgi:ribosome-interacting GTPase 1
MPANLTPDYERAEQRYRAAATDEERLDALRAMFATIPKHKGTEKLQAELKRKISQLRKAAARRPAAKGPDPFHVPRSGAGQVVLVGPPNAGKSALVARLTHAPVKVTDYPFATAVPVPGMCPYEDVQIELVDTPPVTADHVPPGLLGTIRNADVVAVVVDGSEDPLEQAETVLALLAGRGLELRPTSLAELDPSDPNQQSALLVATKSDVPGAAETIATLRDLYAGRFDVAAVSATTGAGLDALVRRLWELLSVVRVHTRQPGKPAENSKPFTLPTGSTIEDLAREIHQELPAKMKFARLWGPGRHPGQQVHRTEVLHDRDVVEIHE